MSCFFAPSSPLLGLATLAIRAFVQGELPACRPTQRLNEDMQLRNLKRPNFSLTGGIPPAPLRAAAMPQHHNLLAR